MRTYVLRRLLQVVPLLLGISALTFLLLQLAPGSFVDSLAENPQVSPELLERMSRNFGLDRPWYVQYALYLRNIFLRLDFGQSFSYHQPVFEVLRHGMFNTLVLAVAGALVTWGLAIPLGVIAAVRQDSWVDRSLSVAAFVWLSIPEVLSGLLLLMFAYETGWFPIGGMRDIDFDRMSHAARFADLLRHLALPALVVGSSLSASRMRQMRASLLDVMRLDYVDGARQGLPRPGGHAPRASQRAQSAHHAVRVHARQPAFRLVRGRVHLQLAGAGLDHDRGDPAPGPVPRHGSRPHGQHHAGAGQPGRRPAAGGGRSADFP
jgi:peptide/nickel transport system permease protein